MVSLPTPRSLARRAEQALERHGDHPLTLFEGRWYVVGFVQVSEDVTEADLIAFCRERISAAKRPREIRVVDAIPLTSVFKADRKALRASLSAASPG